MKLEIRATGVKSWFQYRCERKLVYDSMPTESKQDIPIERNLIAASWSDWGNEFEKQVVEALKQRHPHQVLGPSGGEDGVSDRLTLAFLGRTQKERFIHQASLKETPRLRALLNLPPEISIRPARPDLVEFSTPDGRPTFSIIDVKATQVSTVFHKAQVAFYSLMLRCMLQERGLSGEMSLEGRIWHMPPAGQADLWVEQAFPARGYEAFVIDFFRRTVPRLRERHVERGRDDTFFHIYFKCEQCEYLPHCERAISDARPSEQWDTSAVPGLSHESKRALLNLGVRTVGQLASARNLAANPGASTWALKARGQVLVARAQALRERAVYRLPGWHSWLMPPRVDVAIHLVADRDPVEGNLVALGCLIVRDGHAEPTVAVIRRGEDELPALREVLGRVIQVLTEVDAWNAGHDESQGLHAHIFLYEPSEGSDLQEALGRHLADPAIRTGLLHLIRMFPPDEVRAVEPEYRGIHHLPATALRSVMEQLYALPVKVAYELAGVTRALAEATPPLTTPYRPAPGFQRRFSSRLSVDVVRALRQGEGDAGEVRRDVEARLAAMDALMRWLLQENAAAGEPFLRLRKKPFRFQAQFDPLAATDLEVLMAHEMLENRAALLGTLTELARPADERRDRFRCLANLQLVGTYPDGGFYRLRFFVPPESRQAELSSSTMGVILTDDDPDLRLDPRRWGEVRVRISSDLENGQHVEVRISRNQYNAPGFEALRRRARTDGWFLDAIHVDFNTDRAVRFLRSLADARP
ncbi:PD-(D/E)XK nuclease family protein [Myxococcus sp. AM010]|uniref:PD-(D/E)XK nuclease family protein n=1 Tax=Myxococcus sp. AM010 TaxID=2745138 RepID=UPI00159541DF|nr:PD-(D/E)XK nuclease family protein [Myxococcus sp. AM010]NVJ15319.1 hypothetical protein [Myxococcus sp. AM010]